MKLEQHAHVYTSDVNEATTLQGRDSQKICISSIQFNTDIYTRQLINITLARTAKKRYNNKVYNENEFH